MIWSLKISKIKTFPWLAYGYNIVLINISGDVFEENNSKICMKMHSIWNSQNNLKTYDSQNNFKKENQVGEYILPNFSTCYKITITKTVWFWHDNRSLKQNSPEIDPHIYGKWIFLKVAKEIQWKKTIILKYCWNYLIRICIKITLNHIYCHT